MKNTGIIELETQIENLKNDLISVDSLKTEIKRFDSSKLISSEFPKITSFLNQTLETCIEKTAKIETEISVLNVKIEIEKKAINNTVYNALDYFSSMSTIDDTREFIQDIIKVNYGSKKD